jgi:hypothetical protein
MISPSLDNLRHDTHGDLFGRHRTDADAHRDNDPVDIVC